MRYYCKRYGIEQYFNYDTLDECIESAALDIDFVTAYPSRITDNDGNVVMGQPELYEKATALLDARDENHSPNPGTNIRTTHSSNINARIAPMIWRMGCGMGNMPRISQMI